MRAQLRNNWALFSLCASFSGLLFCLQLALAAYDPKIESDLKYSRDALLKQRDELLAAIDRKAAKIAELQRDNERLNTYLKDTEKALLNIDLALKGD